MVLERRHIRIGRVFIGGVVAKRIVVLPLPYLGVVDRVGDGARRAQMIGMNEIQLRGYVDGDARRLWCRRAVVCVPGLVGREGANAVGRDGERLAVGASGGTNTERGAGKEHRVPRRPAGGEKCERAACGLADGRWWVKAGDGLRGLIDGDAGGDLHGSVDGVVAGLVGGEGAGAGGEYGCRRRRCGDGAHRWRC